MSSRAVPRSIKKKKSLGLHVKACAAMTQAPRQQDPGLVVTHHAARPHRNGQSLVTQCPRHGASCVT